MPADVVAFLNKELNEILKSKAVSEKFEAEERPRSAGRPSR
jgi:hypothetical protein